MKYKIIIEYDNSNSIIAGVEKKELEAFLDSFSKEKVHRFKNGNRGFWANKEKIRCMSFEEINDEELNELHNSKSKNELEEVLIAQQ